MKTTSGTPRPANGPAGTTLEDEQQPIPKGMTLSSYITDRFEEFSRSQKDVARYIVDHLEEAAFQTAEELARRADTSSSTVVRFSQALGFDGFPELQEAARDEYKRRSHAPGAASGEGSESALLTLGNSEFETALATDLVNLDESARRVTLEDVQEVAGLIARAERVVMVGVDQMAFFASYLRHLLALLDLRAEVVASASQEALARLARIDEETLVITLLQRPPARARAARRQARPQAGLLDRRGQRREHLRVDQAVGPLPVLLVQQPFVHTLPLGAAVLIQALAYAVYSNDEAAYEERIKAYKLK